MRITLTNGELLTAASIGVRRHVQAMVRNRKDAFGCSDEDGWRCHIEGAAGEMAVAKALGVYWNGDVGPLAPLDVGPYQVRTASGDSYRLLLTDADRDGDIFVLLTGVAPGFVIRGWIVARDGKRPEYIEDRGRGPRYFVPQSALRPIEELLGRTPTAQSGAA
jgi:hypothetical protein